MDNSRLTASCAIIVLAASASGAVLDLGSHPIDGFQEVPPTGSSGTGTAAITYDTTTDMLSWDISWGGLSGPVTVMHFHGPAPAGSNAGVEVNVGAISGVTSPSIGSAIISPAQAADLIAGLWYINLHTAQFPGGEIRGQVPTPGAAPLLAIAAAASFRRRRIA